MIFNAGLWVANRPKKNVSDPFHCRISWTRCLCFGRCMYFIYLLLFFFCVVSMHFMIFSTRCFWRYSKSTLILCWLACVFSSSLSLSAAQLKAMFEKMCSRNALDDLCALLLLLLCCTWCVHDFQQHKIDGKRAVGLSCIVVDVVSCNLMTNSENILIF